MCDIYQNDDTPNHAVASFVFSFILKDGTQRGGTYIHEIEKLDTCCKNR